jgi:hypothetical protein
MINLVTIFDNALDPSVPAPVTWPTVEELSNAAADVETVGTEQSVESFHKWLKRQGDLHRQLDGLCEGAPPCQTRSVSPSANFGSKLNSWRTTCSSK